MEHHLLMKPNYKSLEFWGKPECTKYEMLPKELRFTPDSWRSYIDRGMLFTDPPIYCNSWENISVIETLACDNGWELILRFTNHSGVCPPGTTSYTWLQRTTWLFAFPGKQLLICITYIESKARRSQEIDIYSECTIYGGYNGKYVNYLVPSRFTRNSGSCDRYTVSSEVRRQVPVNPGEPCKTRRPDIADYDMMFWQEMACMKVSRGQFKSGLYIGDIDGTYYMPGIQTQPQQILGFQVTHKFMQLLLQSNFHKWCLCPRGLDKRIDRGLWKTDGCFSDDEIRQHTVAIQGRSKSGAWAPAMSQQMFTYSELRVCPYVQLLIDDIWLYIKGE